MPTRRTTLAGAGALLAASPVHAAGRPRVEAPFRLSFGRPWTSVWINGEGPFRFIIDTGAELFTVKAAIAPRLGLRTVRGDLLSGGVTGLRTGELYSARDIDIAHAAVLPQAQVVVAETLDEITDGLIPAGLFGLGAVGLDWERQVLVIDRDGAPTTTGFQRAALSRPAFRDRHKLVVDGGLDGAPLRLALDTGAQGDLVLLSAAVKRLGLWDRYPDAVHGRGRGVTGDFSFRTARARSVTVGPLAFDAPLVGLVDPDAVSGSTDYDGLVGIGLLRRMDWTAQVSTGSLYVRANGQGPSRLYVSGLALTDGQPARVAAIAPGSPAARTSLKVGDEVVTKSAMDRRALEWLLTGAQGETVAFEARRDGGAPFAVSIVLQPLL